MIMECLKISGQTNGESTQMTLSFLQSIMEIIYGSRNFVSTNNYASNVGTISNISKVQYLNLRDMHETVMYV